MKVIAAEVAAHLGVLARKAATESRARGVGGFFKTVTGRTRTLYEQRNSRRFRCSFSSCRQKYASAQ
jgi:small ligand-binding sensory domain FIST